MAGRARFGTAVLMALALLLGPPALFAQDDHTATATYPGAPAPNIRTPADLTATGAIPLGKRLMPVDLTALVGLDHRGRGCMPGTWTPVTVRLQNNTDHDLHGTLRLTTSTSTGAEGGGSRVSRPVRVTPHAVETVLTTVFVDPGDTRLEIHFQAATGETVSSTEATLVAPRFTRTMIVLGEATPSIQGNTRTYPHDELSQGGRAGDSELHPIVGHAASVPPSQGEGNSRGRWNVLHPFATELPERWIGYSSISAAVITDPEIVDQMSEMQWNALVGHVRSGGHLVVELATPQAAAYAAANKRLLSILPALAGTAKVIPREELLAAFGGQRDAEGTMPIFPLAVRPEAEARARCAPETVSAEGAVVLAMLPEGMGLVTVTGFDLSDNRIRGKEHTYQALLRQVFEFRPGPGNDFARQNSAASFTRQVDFELKSEELAQIPSHRVLLLFLLAYCLLIGPVNRIVFTRMGRPLGAWLVLPFIVMGFIGIALTKLSIKRPDTPLMREISVVQLRDGDTSGLVRSYLSLYSPDRAVYRIDLPSPEGALQYLVHSEHRGLDRETLAYADGVTRHALDPKLATAEEISAAAAFRLDALSLAPRSSANLQVAQRLPLNGTLRMERTANTEHAIIHNGLSVPLEGGLYMSPKGPSYEIQPVRPGEKVTVGTTANVRGLNDLLGRTGRDRKVIETIVNQLKQPRQQPALLAWTSSSLSSLKCSSATAGIPQTTALTFFLVHPVKGQ